MFLNTALTKASLAMYHLNKVYYLAVYLAYTKMVIMWLHDTFFTPG